jgi:urease accessory protein
MKHSARSVEAQSEADPRQRARGAARARFARAGRRTQAIDLYETGGLRMRFPHARAPCEAVLVNTAGGVAGGDRLSVSLSLDEGAEVEATTPAAEKIYRADGPPSRIETRLKLAAGARFAWLPQETLIFDGAALERRLEVDLSGEAELTMVEAQVFGRLAFGETRIDASLSDSWRIRRDGRLVFAEETRLSHAGATLDRPASGNGARATALMIVAAPNVEARLTDFRAALEAATNDGEVGTSAFDHLLVARFLFRSPQRLRAALKAAILAASGRQAPRLWN